MKIEEKIKLAKSVLISEYMATRGLSPDKEQGKLNKYSSPWANDSNPSFVEYKESNSYCCFATGRAGDVIDLVMELDGLNFLDAVEAIIESAGGVIIKREFKPTRRPKKKFKLHQHISTDKETVRLVNEYALSRKITDGYESCILKLNKDDNWIEYPAIGFAHVDEELNICGVKLRNISGSGESRFRAAGRQCYYILENILSDSMSDPILYIVESESSANSLWSFAKEERISCVVISFGSVSTIPKDVPMLYRGIEDRRIIIDYDGSEELYADRVKKYEKFKGKVIKLRLEKGQDLNSMYIDGSIKFLRLW